MRAPMHTGPQEWLRKQSAVAFNSVLVMDTVDALLTETEAVPGAITDTAGDHAADLASQSDLVLQEQLIRDITSDDLQVLRKVGFKTVLKPHQKVFL